MSDTIKLDEGKAQWDPRMLTEGLSTLVRVRFLGSAALPSVYPLYQTYLFASTSATNIFHSLNYHLQSKPDMRIEIPEPTTLVLRDSTRVNRDLDVPIYTLLSMFKMHNNPPTLTFTLEPPPTHINVMIKTFGGLGLPSTLNIPVNATCTVRDLVATLHSRIPATTALASRLTTTNRKHLSWHSDETMFSLLKRTDVDNVGALMMNLHLRVLTPGGKGGFGSQLRAAGGRMSSRKNRRNPEQQNASNRNLDGRRLRTITEAKNLAAYLTMKPDMDKKEREEKRKRWEAVVEAAERKEDEIKRGKGGNVRLDGQWVEQKEEVEGKTRDAVLAAMKAGLIGNEALMFERTGSESSASADEDYDSEAEAMEAVASGSSASSSGADDKDKPTASKSAPASSAPASRTFFGWDEDDEDMSDEEEEEDEDEEEPAPVAYEGKGKGKA